jgi:hypothetical protein
MAKTGFEKAFDMTDSAPLSKEVKGIHRQCRFIVSVSVVVIDTTGSVAFTW